MDTRMVAKQVALSLFTRRKKWIVLTMLVTLVLLLPVAYVLSKEPPRYRTTATVLIENKAGRSPVFQEFAPYRPLSVQLAILQSRLLAASVVEALPKASVDDLIHNPYGRDYLADAMEWFDRLRGLVPPAPSPQKLAVAELRRDRVKFMTQPGNTGIVEIRPKRLSLRSPSTSRILTSRCCWPEPARSMSTTRRARGSICRSRRVQVSDTLARNEAALRAFTMSRGGIQIPAKSLETAQRLSQLETTLAEVQANKNISQARLVALEGEARGPAGRPGSRPRPWRPLHPSIRPSAQRLRAKLASLEAQMVEAKTRYSEDHPRVRSLAQQIGEIQRELGDAIKESTASSPGMAAECPPTTATPLSKW